MRSALLYRYALRIVPLGYILANCNLRDDRRLGFGGQCEWPASASRRSELGHVVQESAGTAIEIRLTAAAPQVGAHLIRNITVEADFPERPEKGRIVNEAFAQRYRPNGVRL